jgi:hypothetical protein
LYVQQHGGARSRLNIVQEVRIMKKNIGKVERIVRVFGGLAIMSLAFVGPESPWAYLGIVPLATGLVGWCPPYALLGISTCKECK